MKKYLFLLIAFLALGSVAFAQDDDLPPPTSQPKEEAAKAPDEEFKGFKTKKKVDLSKFIIEPSFNFSINSNRIDAGLSPYVGYQLWKGLYGGGGITYFYTGFRNLPVSNAAGVQVGRVNAHFHTYGGGIFLQYNIWKGFFARAKFEVLHRKMDEVNGYVYLKDPNNPNSGYYFKKIDKTLPALLVGAGYNLLQSKNFFLPLMVSYNLLTGITDKAYTLYPNGVVIQLGFITLF